MLTPILLDKSAFGAYFLFGGLALFTVVVLGACMPETRGRSLEDIQQAFHQPALRNLASKLKGSRFTNASQANSPSEVVNENVGIELRSLALEASAVHPSPVLVATLARGLRD